MEKLIELIGEWQKEMHPDGIYLPVVAYRDGIFWSDSDCLSSVMDEIHLISKTYGFIEWLVDNDKIDLNKIKLFSIFKEDRYYNAYQSILMALSISDEPIQFLISILK